MEKKQLSPAEQKIMDDVASMVRVKHESRRTGEAYGHAVVNYRRWLKTQPHLSDEKVTSEMRLNAYLTADAPHIAAKTQNQRLCAIVRYYAEVLRKPLGDIGTFGYAHVPKRLPVWLNHAEIKRLLVIMGGTTGLMARLTYGAGLRLMEITRLRTQDIDFEQRIIFVREGKGNKDRVVPLPASLVHPLADHLQRVRGLWDADQERRTNPVQVPESVGRKIPQSGGQWGWFWVFPSAGLSRDPETGIIRRHHVTRNCLQKAVSGAAVKAAIHKRVTVHTLRHTFATHHLERGTHIEQLRQLLGHESIETTMIYLHCLPKAVNAAGSPLDDIEPTGQVIPFSISAAKSNAVRSFAG